MRHFRGFAGPPRCAIFVVLHMSHCELCKCKWESFMTNQNICCDSALASSVLADAESYFWVDFLQGESVAESGSIISHYFRTYFSLYVVPRGLTTSSLRHKLLRTHMLKWPGRNHMQHVVCFSCTCHMPRGTKGQLSCWVWQPWNHISRG